MRIKAMLVGGLVSVAVVTNGMALPDAVSMTTIESYPPGAMISYDGNELGGAPITIAWVVGKDGMWTRAAGGDKKPSATKIIKATWISGASTSAEVEIKGGGKNTYTLKRPKGVAGIDGDIQWGIHIQQQEAEAMRLDAQKSRDDRLRRIEAQREQERRDYEFGQRMGNAISRGISSSGGSGGTTLCPDGTYVGGDRCVLTPDGRWVGGY